jgi:signal transduction histidine kinase
MSLATRFALASGVILILAATAIGSWVTTRIEAAVVNNSADSTAIFMESFLSPISDQLDNPDGLGPGAKRALEEVFNTSALRDRVVSYKIWRPDGTVIEASNKEIVGQTFPISDQLRRAWAGEVVADFNALGRGEDLAESEMGLPLVEIYSPVHEAWSGRIVAVAEFYEVNQELKTELTEARLSAWATVFGIVLGLGSILYGIVLGGSRTIEAQRRDLDDQLGRLADLSDRNTELRLRVQGAAGRAAEQTDQTMRRIGADLHDGAAQYLAYAALRLDSLRDKLPDGAAEGELDAVRNAVNSAMKEVRALAKGLSLPEMADRPAAAIIRSAAEAHEVRTGHAVAVTIDCATEPVLTQAIRICIFRFVQEGLTNASRHADGLGLAVLLTCLGRRISLSVRDQGPGLVARPDEADSDAGGLGLAGLRDRVESLGGSFAAVTLPAGGTEISMTLDTGTDP